MIAGTKACARATKYLRKGNGPTHRRSTFARFAANRRVPGGRLYIKEQEAPGYSQSPGFSDERTNGKVFGGSHHHYLVHPKEMTDVQMDLVNPKRLSCASSV